MIEPKYFICRIFHKLDSLASKVSVNAMEVTQSVVNTQNMERKKFIEHIKMAMTHGLQIKKSWQHLIQQLTHERYDFEGVRDVPAPDPHPTHRFQGPVSLRN
jgi:hypothetical protein